MSAGSKQSLQQSAAYQELVRALENHGCPLCSIAQAQTRTHIGGMLWDSVTDPSSRARLDASLGLCGRHSREMLTFAGERLAISIVQQAVMKCATRQLSGSPPGPRRTWFDGWRKRLTHWFGKSQAGSTQTSPLAEAHDPESHASAPAQAESCPACEVENRTEERVAEVLIRHNEDDLDAPLSRAGGLCRPHLYFCLARAPESQHKALIELHEKVWSELGGHLEEFIRKRDHRFSHEPITDAERDAVERSVRIMTGGDPLYPPRKDKRR